MNVDLDVKPSLLFMPTCFHNPDQFLLCKT